MWNGILEFFWGLFSEQITKMKLIHTFCECSFACCSGSLMSCKLKMAKSYIFYEFHRYWTWYKFFFPNIILDDGHPLSAPDSPISQKQRLILSKETYQKQKNAQTFQLCEIRPLNFKIKIYCIICQDSTIKPTLDACMKDQKQIR